MQPAKLSIRATFFALSVVVASTAFAQDSLFYSNGSVIVGQVEEIGVDVIKYRTTSDGNPVLIAVNKQDLSRVRLQSGQDFNFVVGGTISPYSAAFVTRKNTLSVDVIAPALNHITINYERVLAPRIGLAVKAGYIGLWQQDDFYSDVFGSKGGLLTAGVKFILPRSASRITPPGDAHPLAGWYLRPELLFSAWKKTDQYYVSYPHPFNYTTPVDVTYHYTSAAVVLSIGRTLFLGEHVTFDISGGLGYGAEWRDGHGANTESFDSPHDDYAFSHAFIGNNMPLVVTGGLRFGYAF